MAIKVVMVFQQTTNEGSFNPELNLAGRAHIGGWTEHVIWPSDSVDQLMQALTAPFAGRPGLLPSRASILNGNGTILGVRLYQGGAGRGQFRAVAFSGDAGIGDIPQMSLLCTIGVANSPTVRRFTLRGINDSAVVGGEANLGPELAGDIKAYGQALGNFAALTDDVVTTYPVFGISGAGLVTLNNVNNPFLKNDIVAFRQVVVTATGERVGGKFVIDSVGPENNQFKVADWTAGPARKGDVRKPTKSVKMMDSSTFTVSRIVSRKVGRPFELYRGRRSKRVA